MAPLMPAPTEQTWSKAPSLPRARAGVVEVWRADLAIVDDRLGDLLNAEESARAASLLSERDRLLWTRSRGVLRALLGRYLDLEPALLRFSRAEHGKPMLEVSGTRTLHFNMSHSGEIALYALSPDREVGVDVEVARRPIDELGIAARVLGDAEVRRLSALDGEARTREFLRAWTSHEAEVKCRGTGLAGHSESLTDLWTAQLDLRGLAAAAVAAQGSRCELRLWEWGG